MLKEEEKELASEGRYYKTTCNKEGNTKLDQMTNT